MPRNLHTAINGRQHDGPAQGCGECERLQALGLHELYRIHEAQTSDAAEFALSPSAVVDYDRVNPPHYKGQVYIPIGPCNTYGTLQGFTRSTMQRNNILHVQVDCIDVFREFDDPRLATALKYIWRVGLAGGKPDSDPMRDIRSAIWYLEDYVHNSETPSTGSTVELDNDMPLPYDKARAYAADDGVDYSSQE